MRTKVIDEATRKEIYKISNQSNMHEIKLHRNLNICAIAGILSIPLTGPFGPAYSGAVIIGKLIRKYTRKNTRESYRAQCFLDKVEKREEYLEKVQEGTKIIQEQMQKLSSNKLEDLTGASINVRRDFFGRSKLETRMKYE